MAPTVSTLDGGDRLQTLQCSRCCHSAECQQCVEMLPFEATMPSAYQAPPTTQARSGAISA